MLLALEEQKKLYIITWKSVRVDITNTCTHKHKHTQIIIEVMMEFSLQYPTKILLAHS